MAQPGNPPPTPGDGQILVYDAAHDRRIGSPKDGSLHFREAFVPTVERAPLDPEDQSVEFCQCD